MSAPIRKTRDVAGILHFLTPKQMAEEIVRLDAVIAASGWRTVERDGLPPCDDHTVFVGINTAGFAACFNHVSDNGTCTMGTAESCTAQMSCLRWWKVLDRPDAAPQRVPSADWNTDYHYPRAAS